MNPASQTVRIYHSDSLPEVTTLDAQKLGRPWHKLPKIINDRFDITDSQLSLYFLKKLRVNVSLKNMSFSIDKSYRNSQIFSTQFGYIAISIDRSLLLNILYDYYGLRDDSNPVPVAIEDEKVTKTEERLRIKVGKELTSLLVDEDSFGCALDIKVDNSAVMTKWAWCITYTLAGYEHGTFTVLFDEKHVDYYLARLRVNAIENGESGPESPTPAQIESMFHCLPLKLNARLANLNLTVAQLSDLKAGDIIPIFINEPVPVFIGKEQIFEAEIAEDRGKLFLNEIAGSTVEKQYE
jgi:flagellar motor switch protein FliM